MRLKSTISQIKLPKVKLQRRDKINFQEVFSFISVHLESDRSIFMPADNKQSPLVLKLMIKILQGAVNTTLGEII